MEEGRYYTEAVAWAKETGLVKGVTPERFCPNSPVTREQFAAILYRYAQLQGQDVSNQADLSAYLDAGKLSHYAQSPMAWAVAEGLIRAYPKLPSAPKPPAPGPRQPSSWCATSLGKPLRPPEAWIASPRLHGNCTEPHTNWGRVAPQFYPNALAREHPAFLRGICVQLKRVRPTPPASLRHSGTLAELALAVCLWFPGGRWGG